MKLKGSVSIFSALIFISIVSLVCVLLESARTAGLRWQLQCIASSGLDNIMAEYQKTLWKEFRILGLEYIDDKDIEEGLNLYEKGYFDNNEWFTYKDYGNKVKEKYFLFDKDGLYLEKEILDFMKYEILDIGDINLDDIAKKSNSSKTLDDIGKDYYDGGKYAVAINDIVYEILAENEALISSYERMGGGINSNSCNVVISSGKSMLEEIKKLNKLIKKYENAYSKYVKDINKHKDKHGKSLDNVDKDIEKEVEDKLSEFDKLIGAEEERYKRISDVVKNNAGYKDEIESCINIAYDIEDSIDSEDEDIDVSEMFDDLRDEYEIISIISLEESNKKGDDELKKKLFELKDLIRDGFLSLVVDIDKVSKEKVNIELPSQINKSKYGKKSLDPISKLAISEYFGRYTDCFTDSASIASESINYEMEYIVTGLKNDRDALSGAVLELILLRTGFNMVHIFSDSSKMAQVRELATVIMGIFALPPLIPIMMFLIINVWSFAESIIDVRSLLSGNKVDLYKSGADWKLSLNNLFNFLNVYKELSEENKSEKGFTYKSYLKILIALVDDKKRNFRFADIISMHFKEKNINIDVLKLLYGMDIELSAGANHMFSSLFFDGGKLDKEFRIKVFSYESY